MWRVGTFAGTFQTERKYKMDITQTVLGTSELYGHIKFYFHEIDEFILCN